MSDEESNSSKHQAPEEDAPIFTEDDQNLPLGIVATLGAAIFGGIIWGLITFISGGHLINWMAVGLGPLVGFAVRRFGNGRDKIFGIVGAGFTLVGCLIGILLSGAVEVSQVEGKPLLDSVFIAMTTPWVWLQIPMMTLLVSPIIFLFNLLFYGIAIYQGYKLSFRKLSETGNEKAAYKKLLAIGLVIVFISVIIRFLPVMFPQGFQIKSAKLRALENSVSIVELKTGREVRRSLTDDGKALGKPTYAEVQIVYEPINNHTKLEVLEEIGAVLKKNNWNDYGNAELDYSGTSYHFRTFSQYGGYPVGLWVNTSPDKNQIVLIAEEDNSFYHSPPLPTPIPRATNSTPELKVDSITMKGRDGMILLYVPAGEFTMGRDNDDFDNKPLHTVYLDAFWIDQTEVTNEMYEKCMEAGQCTPSYDSKQINISSYAKRPVVYMNWENANAYCSWAGRRLPTEAEWEKAARGTDGRTYPWGEGIDCDKANYEWSCARGTSPVGSYEEGKSPYGAYDMAGNVWEWVNDWYDENYYQSSPLSNPLGPDSGKSHVRRGGSWNSYDHAAGSARRHRNSPSLTDSTRGFRCARSDP